MVKWEGDGGREKTESGIIYNRMSQSINNHPSKIKTTNKTLNAIRFALLFFSLSKLNQLNIFWVKIFL